ncbi:hypothetical protein RRG08_003670 [Elysia crispata]|uniref:MAM domain-containing protein n=1 Tax=Elysia crispata TaxID=231223 RepID=A0AAE1E4X6_9GAST|nr:hypothetical protein RRG08_003670 [Elysia crispata]
MLHFLLLSCSSFRAANTDVECDFSSFQCSYTDPGETKPFQWRIYNSSDSTDQTEVFNNPYAQYMQGSFLYIGR